MYTAGLAEHDEIGFQPRTEHNPALCHTWANAGHISLISIQSMTIVYIRRTAPSKHETLKHSFDVGQPTATLT